MSIKTTSKQNEISYEKPPPVEHCYGHIVFIAVTILAINVTIPIAIFGIVFGKFLSNLGDETTGTSLANGIFNTVLSFTGLAANVLLNKWSCRNVGLLGALASTIGSFSLFFVRDLTSFMVFFGVFQGFGYGLLIPASLTALNNFFKKKLIFMQSLSQAVMIGGTMLAPPMVTIAMDIYGYRRTLLWLGCITLMNIPSATVLSRFNWPCKQRLKQGDGNNIDIAYAENGQISIKCKSSNDVSRDCKDSKKPLLNKHNSLRDIASIPNESKVLRVASVASVNGINISEKSTREEEKSIWISISSLVDLSLLKNLKYVNCSLGLSLSYTSDICFITIIPVVLSENGFNSSDISLTMAIFFAGDLVSRVLLSVYSALRIPRSRYLFLWGSLLSAIFRIGFVSYHSFLWKIVTLAALGFLRCFIQTPLPLVIAEEYHDQFSTAYSLYMVVCGVVSLVMGVLMGFIKTLTNSDVMVCHLLTSCYLICVISWICEMMIDLRTKRRKINEQHV